MHLRYATAVLLIGLLAPLASWAQPQPGARPAADIRVSELNDQVVELALKNESEQAFVLAQEALRLSREEAGVSDLARANAMRTMGEMLADRARITEAEALIEEALELRRKALGPEHRALIQGFGYLGYLNVRLARFAKAEQSYRAALALSRKILGPMHIFLARYMNELGWVLWIEGKDVEAEALYKDALRIVEAGSGREHPMVAIVLGNIAQMYLRREQYSMAEPLLQRAFDIQRAQLEPRHESIARTLNGLAISYRAQQRLELAEAASREALAIQEKAYGEGHPATVRHLVQHGQVLGSQKRFAEAEAYLQRAVLIMEKAPDRQLVFALSNLAKLSIDQGDYRKAREPVERSVAVAEALFPDGHPARAMALANLAEVQAQLGHERNALVLQRRATHIWSSRVAALEDEALSAQDTRFFRASFFRHLAYLRGQAGDKPSLPDLDESFQLAQLAHDSDTGDAIAKMAVRFAARNDGLADLIRRRQDAQQRRAQLDELLTSAAGLAPAQRDDAAEKRMREDMGAAAAAVKQADADLQARFPEFQQLTRPSPLALAQAQSLLKAREAMLVYLMGDASYIWVITRDKAHFTRVNVAAEQIASRVKRVRESVEPDDAARLKPVDLAALFGLYSDLVQPIESQLSGIDHLVIVPSRALQSLPFSMLVTAEVGGAAASNYRSVPWLARRFSTSVLPSVASLRAVRQLANRSVSTAPFAGFGDPSLGSQQPAPRSTSSLELRGLFGSSRVVDGGNGTGVALADGEAIRRAASLPETADELRALARILKSTEKSVWLRDEATETNIKRMDLSRFRVLAFATHGVMAGELSGAAEPGLIFTPPAQSSAEDDGYLSASEIAGLHFNADWIILSACNTAAADGTPGAEGFSGLAKAFFYAGARSLLVSHWPIESSATVSLTTAMLQAYEADQSLGKAEAHRRSMLALMNSRGGEFAHPFFWAPFVVVGEGDR